ADAAQGAVEHHVHRVVDVGALGVFAQRDLLVTVENGADGLAHRELLGETGGIYPGRTPRPRPAGRDGGTTEAGRGPGRLATRATAVGRRASRYSGRARPASRLRGEGLSQ